MVFEYKYFTLKPLKKIRPNQYIVAVISKRPLESLEKKVAVCVWAS